MIKTAIVIGGSKRLGFQITRYLLKNHYQVFVLSRTENFISKIERKIPIDNLTVYKMDLADLEEVDFATNKLLENIQKVDLIFNIAGSEYLGKLETIGFEELTYILDAYVRGNIFLYKKILPLIKKSYDTHIFNFSTNWAIDKVGYESGNSIFTTTKAALSKFLDSLTSEYWKDGLSTTNFYLGALQDSTNNIISIDDRGDAIVISYKDIIELLNFLIKAKTLRITDITVLPKEKGCGKDSIHYNGIDYDTR